MAPTPGTQLQAHGTEQGALQQLGPYQIVRELGKGGMGLVYEAVDPRLDRRVALKVIRAGEIASADEIRRFKLEAQNAAKLKHPNIVPVYDVGEVHGLDYFVMEYVEGETLDEWLRGREHGNGERTHRERAAMIEKVARAIHHAHEQGIVHRDLKPGNVMVDASGEPHVMDFGLAKQVESAGRLTRTGQVMGTPLYMAPEQARGETRHADARTDVWALGAVLYEMITGLPPFVGATDLDILQKVICDDPFPPRRYNRACPRDVATICLKCLEKDPARRYRTAQEFAEDCRRFLAGETIAARPASLVYRARKRLGRHKGVAAVTAAAVAAVSVIAVFKGAVGALLLAGAAVLAVVIWSYIRILRARNEAVRQGELAQVARREAEAARKSAEKALEIERRFKRELGAAAQVQAGLLPAKIPQIPGYDFFPYYRSAREIGGDYYDVFPIDREHLGMVVADVSGAGIPGAMVMASTRTLLRVLGPECGTAAETLRQANMHIARLVKRGMFVTAVYAVLNVYTGAMEICSAGHNPVVVYKESSGKCALLNPNGLALGFDKGPTFDRTLKESRLVLEPGDRIVIYTDGVVEAMNSRDEQYGRERFYKFCLDHARMRSRDFVRALVRDLDDHSGGAEQQDDVTILTVRALG